jgi:cell division protein FtsN
MNIHKGLIMTDKKKEVIKNEPESSTGAVLPDPEEIKLPFPKNEAEQRTVVDVNKPTDSNAVDDTDHSSFDYRRNK